MIESFQVSNLSQAAFVKTHGIPITVNNIIKIMYGRFQK